MKEEQERPITDNLVTDTGNGWVLLQAEYSAEFRLFVQATKQHRDMLSDLETGLEKWIRQGITFNDELSTGIFLSAGKPEYNNMPESLELQFGDVQEKIVFSILQFKGLPEKFWPIPYMTASAQIMPGGIEQNAQLLNYAQNLRPAIWPVWDTREKGAKVGAQIIAENYYQWHVQRLFTIISDCIKRADIFDGWTSWSGDSGNPTIRSWGAADIDSALDLQQNLINAKVDLKDRLTYYCSFYYNFEETAEVTHTTKEEVQTTIHRVEDKLGGLLKNRKRFLQYLKPDLTSDKD